MFLVDTNVVSEARRGAQAAVSWLRSVDPNSLYLSVVTLGEIMRGAAAKKKSDPRSAARFYEWLQQIRRDFQQRVLPIGEDVAIEWGRLSVMRTRGVADGLIAATAIVHDLIIVTRNTADFQDLQIAVLNPWDAYGSSP